MLALNLGVWRLNGPELPHFSRRFAERQRGGRERGARAPRREAPGEPHAAGPLGLHGAPLPRHGLRAIFFLTSS